MDSSLSTALAKLQPKRVSVMPLLLSVIPLQLPLAALRIRRPFSICPSINANPHATELLRQRSSSFTFCSKAADTDNNHRSLEFRRSLAPTDSDEDGLFALLDWLLVMLQIYQLLVVSHLTQKITNTAQCSYQNKWIYFTD